MSGRLAAFSWDDLSVFLAHRVAGGGGVGCAKAGWVEYCFSYSKKGQSVVTTLPRGKGPEKSFEKIEKF
jgi:hypothetical protein